MTFRILYEQVLAIQFLMLCESYQLQIKSEINNVTFP